MMRAARFATCANAGFDNVSFDLIAGLPGQTMTGWRRNLEEAFALRPEHLSFYLLEVHQGTPLASHIESGLQPSLMKISLLRCMKWMLDRAAEAGYEHYENFQSLFAGTRVAAQHQILDAAPYYGFGCSAHSYDGASRRWANERDLNGYMEMIGRGEPAIVDETRLSESDSTAEAVFLGLRMMRGFSFANKAASLARTCARNMKRT